MASEQTLTPEQQNELLFTQLVLMFQGAAYQHMGKVMNPVTNKVERDLGQAKHAIDMLGMLDARTRGNLTDNEARLLEHVLYETRMNYVDEVNKGTQPSEGEEAPEENKAEAQPEVEAPQPEGTGEPGAEASAGEKEDGA